MIALLPAELRPLFEKRRAFIVERAIDPDLWRNVGWEEEPPNHFLDLDSRSLRPVSFDGAAARLRRGGAEIRQGVIHEQGLLPWRTAEFYGRLQREFESLKRQPAPGYAVDNIVLYSAMLAHYVADGHVPLHAVVNYNGQLTGSRASIRAGRRSCSNAIARRLTVAPPAMAPVTDPRDFMFETCSPATAPPPTCSSRTRRPPKAASSTTMGTSRRSRRARCRCSSGG